MGVGGIRITPPTGPFLVCIGVSNTKDNFTKRMVICDENHSYIVVKCWCWARSHFIFLSKVRMHCLTTYMLLQCTGCWFSNRS